MLTNTSICDNYSNNSSINNNVNTCNISRRIASNISRTIPWPPSPLSLNDLSAPRRRHRRRQEEEEKENEEEEEEEGRRE